MFLPKGEKMQRIEKNIWEIFISVGKYDKCKVPFYRSIKGFIASFYSDNRTNLPLIFLSPKAYEMLISSEVKYYEPEVKITVNKLNNYIGVKVEVEEAPYINYYVYILKKEMDDLYSIRGFIALDHHCFAPNDMDKEEIKHFINDTSVPFYSQKIKFDYPLYIEG